MTKYNTDLLSSRTVASAQNVGMRHGVNIVADQNGDPQITTLIGRQSPSLTQLAIELGSDELALMWLKDHGCPVSLGAERHCCKVI
jgi:hypothetical protein